ncbi:MAG: ankyrin repeat domain-containing protein [Sulfuritalea sp.]|nr:ankyrin repeat domain-containing protein [Sulfuritalea sp.]
MKNLLLACLLCAALLPAARAELPDPVRFSIALELGDLKQATAWLDAGLEPDFEGHLIGTGLMIGAWEGNIPLMELFHRRGADLDRANRFGETALMLAAWKNRRDAVRWLLDRGAQPNRGSGEARQWTALHYASFGGHGALVETLLGSGADINARSTNGSTVVMMAAREGHADLAKRLLEAGANPALKNDYGEDAVAWAMRQGHYDIARTFTGAANFAALVRQAAEQPLPPPARSHPAPDRADELLRKARLAEMDGKRDAALLLYQQAWSELKTRQEPQKVGAGKTAAGGQKKAREPKALVIRARRAAPEKQSLSITYAESDARSVDQLLERARAAENEGRRQEALQLYRRAAESIRAGQP